MRICIVTPEFAPAPGGIGTFYGWLVEILADAGHQVTVIAPQYAGDAPRLPRIELIQIPTYGRMERALLQARLNIPRDAAEWLIFAGKVRQWLKQNMRARALEVIEGAAHRGIGASLIEPALPPTRVW